MKLYLLSALFLSSLFFSESLSASPQPEDVVRYPTINTKIKLRLRTNYSENCNCWIQLQTQEDLSWKITMISPGNSLKFQSEVIDPQFVRLVDPNSRRQANLFRLGSSIWILARYKRDTYLDSPISLTLYYGPDELSLVPLSQANQFEI